MALIPANQSSSSETYYISTPLGYIGFKSKDIRKLYVPDIVTYYCIYTDTEVKLCNDNFRPINKDLWNDLFRRLNYNCIYTKNINGEYSLIFDLQYVDSKTLSFKIFIK